MLNLLWTLLRIELSHAWEEVSKGYHRWIWRILFAMIFIDGVIVGVIL